MKKEVNKFFYWILKSRNSKCVQKFRNFLTSQWHGTILCLFSSPQLIETPKENEKTVHLNTSHQFLIFFIWIIYFLIKQMKRKKTHDKLSYIQFYLFFLLLFLSLCWENIFFMYSNIQQKKERRRTWSYFMIFFLHKILIT